MLHSRIKPPTTQIAAITALAAGAIRTENSVNTSLHAIDVHRRIAFQDVRINTTQPVRVTENGRFI